MQQPSTVDLSTRWVARVALSAAVLLSAAWVLAGPISVVLASPAVTAADQHAAGWIHAHAGAVAMSAFIVLTELHGTAGVLALAAACIGWLWPARRRALWPLLLASVPGGLLLNVGVKVAVQRARPAWGYAYEAIPSYSFPSGHTAGATVLYGFVLLLLWPSLRSKAVRAGLLLGCIAMVVLVAASRIALGVHYLSDCIAAACEGTIWLAVCWVGVRRPVAWAPA
jgi:membrane-associated phospholipid phosphatase